MKYNIRYECVCPFVLLSVCHTCESHCGSRYCVTQQSNVFGFL